MTLKKKYKQNIEDHFIELHKKLSALQLEHLKKIMNYITHGDTNMTPKPTFETVPVTFESDTVKDTKNILDNNGKLKDTSEFQRSEANRASLEKHISESDKEKVWKNIDGSIVGTKEVTFESDKSWMDCDKCDVHSPCAEHSVDESEKWREEFDSGDFFLHSELAVDMTTVENIDLVDSKKLKDFISNLLTKERNKLLNQLLKEAPEDLINNQEDSDCDWAYGKGNNHCNQIWKNLLEKLKVK